MIAAQDYDNARNWLHGCRRPLLVTHRRPDGDALGALAALDAALRTLGLEPRCALYEPLPRRYALLQDAVSWQQWDEAGAALRSTCDALVIVDTCARSQLEPLGEFLGQPPRTLVIDHHPAPEPIGLRPHDLRLIDDSASAVCLVVAEWLNALGVTLTPAMATALFTGLATDTGWFRFSSTDVRTLQAAAELVAAGAVPDTIFRAIYEQDPAARLRLIGRMLQALELHADGKLAVLKLRGADFAAAGADRGMTEDLVNEATRLGGTEATLLFTEEPDRRVHVNFRSKRTLDVRALAQQFGGGGHTRAAGARPPGAWDDVVARVVAATAAALAATAPA